MYLSSPAMSTSVPEVSVNSTFQYLLSSRRLVFYFYNDTHVLIDRIGDPNVSKLLLLLSANLWTVPLVICAFQLSTGLCFGFMDKRVRLLFVKRIILGQKYLSFVHYPQA